MIKYCQIVPELTQSNYKLWSLCNLFQTCLIQENCLQKYKHIGVNAALHCTGMLPVEDIWLVVGGEREVANPEFWLSSYFDAAFELWHLSHKLQPFKCADKCELPEVSQGQAVGPWQGAAWAWQPPTLTLAFLLSSTAHCQHHPRPSLQ